MGQLVTGLANYSNSPLVAESLAVREALLLASSCFCDTILVESDCLHLVEACRNQIAIPPIAMVICDILQLKKQFLRCGFLWTPRSTNAVAHLVAQKSLRGLLNADWVLHLPNDLITALSLDVA